MTVSPDVTKTRWIPINDPDFLPNSNLLGFINRCPPIVSSVHVSIFFLSPFLEEFIWNFLGFFLRLGGFVMHCWRISLEIVGVFVELVILVMVC